MADANPFRLLDRLKSAMNITEKDMLDLAQPTRQRVLAVAFEAMGVRTLSAFLAEESDSLRSASDSVRSAGLLFHRHSVSLPTESVFYELACRELGKRFPGQSFKPDDLRLRRRPFFQALSVVLYAVNVRCSPS